MTYSYSSIELYESCPWAFRKVKIDDIKRQTSEALETGRTVHDRIANYLERLIQTKTRTDWQWAEQKQLASGDSAAIWQLFVSNFTLPDMEAPGVENKLGFDQNWNPTGFFDPEVHFRGVIDFHFRQGDLAVVIDWKTNRKIPESVDKNLQLRTYGWAIKRAVYPDAQEVLLRLHFLRYGANQQVLLTPDDLAKVPDELDEKIARIEADKKFHPTPGSFCGWCGLTAHCPVMTQALVPVEILIPTTREQAEKAALLLLALQTLGKELTVRLKQWAQEYGPIKVGNLVYGLNPYASYTFDPQAVVQTLLEAGLDREVIWPLLSVSKTTLERGLKKLKRKDVLEQVLAEASGKTTERYEFHQQEQEVDQSSLLPAEAA